MHEDRGSFMLEATGTLKHDALSKLVLLNLFSESPIVVRSRCFQTDTSLKMVLVDETSC